MDPSRYRSDPVSPIVPSLKESYPDQETNKSHRRQIDETSLAAFEDVFLPSSSRSGKSEEMVQAYTASGSPLGAKGLTQGTIPATVEGTSEDLFSEGKSVGPAADDELDQNDQEMVAELESRDREVRAHENAHAATGGAYASAPSYSYQVGPNGKRYAVGGEVQIDLAPIEGNPEATIRKMQTVIRAAKAPAEPSSQDQRVAATATQTLLGAQQEIAEKRAGRDESGSEKEAVPSASPSETDVILAPPGVNSIEHSPTSVYIASRYQLLSPSETPRSQSSHNRLDLYI